MGEDYNQEKHARLTQTATACVRLPNGKNIVCTWVRLRGKDYGDSEVNEWVKQTMSKMVNTDCQRESKICRLFDNIFKPSGRKTCWDCDFREDGLDQESADMIASKLSGSYRDDWQNTFHPNVRSYPPSEQVILLNFNKSDDGKIITVKPNKKRTYPETIRKRGESTMNKTGRSNPGGHSRLSRYELRNGEETEDLGKISIGLARKKAQERANEIGKKLTLWKCVFRKNKWSEVGLFSPVEAVGENNQNQQKLGQDTTATKHSNGEVEDISFLPKNGFQTIAQVLLNDKATSDNGAGRDFCILKSRLNDFIAGSYLDEERIKLLQSHVDGLNRLFPGSMKLVKVEISLSQQQELINCLLAYCVVQGEP